MASKSRPAQEWRQDRYARVQYDEAGVHVGACEVEFLAHGQNEQAEDAER